MFLLPNARIFYSIILNGQQGERIRKFQQNAQKAIDGECSIARTATAQTRAYLSRKITATALKGINYATQIEELKSKYDAVEEQLASCLDQNSGQKQLIDEQHRALQLLEDKLAESERRRTQAESALGRAVEIEREKNRNKMGELSSQVQQLRREAKAKDMLLFELQDQIESTRGQMKEQFLQEKRKYAAEW